MFKFYKKGGQHSSERLIYSDDGRIYSITDTLNSFTERKGAENGYRNDHEGKKGKIG